jgi:Xaa-Pro aminopeptidase
MQQYLSALSIKALPYDMVEDSLPNKTGECVVWVDAQQVNERMYQQLSMRYALLDKEDWCVSQKSCKTLAEIAGIQEAMQYDAVAWVRSLKWLDEQLSASVLVSELDFQQAMLHFKQQMPHYMGESFAPIVGYGSHGAIVHYEATAASNASLQASGFLLVDAGSHYRHGTTDATRTIACGSLSDLERKVYTLVLKGMIAVATCRFTEATPSSEIDALAREALRNHGFDYGHGTGHGVGIVLNVHEEGARLSPKSVKPLKEGMVLSDEPGYYQEGDFGIRIENMLAVSDLDKSTYTFSVLTLIPLELKAICIDLLSSEEKKWVNDYHRRIRESLFGLLTEEEYNWLKNKTYEI